MVEQKMTRRVMRTEPRAMVVIEGAIYLLRRRNWVALAEYYLGTLPFVLALLYFWSDMSGNPMAVWYCGPSAAGVALLFIWMKMWQVRFCRRLWCHLQNEAPENWTWKRALSTAVRQTILHATGVVILPLAFITLFSLAWVYAFYQNLCVLEDARPKGAMKLARAAKEQSVLWPGQNHVILLVMKLFGVIVYLNIAITVAFLPYLLKSILGIETVFTLSGAGLLNTTFLAIVAGLSYLCLDPVMKAIYVLRCFYGRSRRTADDLKSVLRPFLNGAAMTMAALLFLLPPAITLADDPQTLLARSPTIDNHTYARQLDGQIEDVLAQRRFAWRLPREEVPQPPEEQGWLGMTFQWIGEKIKAFFRLLNQWIEDFFEWLRKKMPSLETSPSSEKGDYRSVIRWIFYALGFGLALWLIYLLFRWFKNAQPVRSGEVENGLEPLAVDLNDELITAEDLPLDRWLTMAREMMERKDFRRALRAMYLSVLAQLADAQRVKIARYKSNRDYALELARREHAEPELRNVFDRCIRMFERSWYGMHPVDKSSLEQFMEHQKRIAALV
ncbi:MAG: DUF4129 domain-containing protein [Desulfobacteraceae bacterium]